MHHLNPSDSPRLTFLALVLLAAIGPLSIDLFTPSLPEITHAFDTTAGTSQWTISMFMLGFALSMLIVGQLSARFGYRRTLMGGYFIYLLATLAILLTPHIEVVIIARLIQAVFGCFGTALARVTAIKLFQGQNKDIHILGMIGSAMMIAPMIAPSIGGALQETWGWQANFVLMLVMGAMGILVVAALPSPNDHDSSNTPFSMITSIRTLCLDHHYMVPALAAATAFSGAFVFVVGAPFILIERFAIAPSDYGIIFGLIMGAYIIASHFAGKITDYLGHSKAVILAWVGLILGALIAFSSAVFSDGLSVSGLVMGMMIYEMGLGLFLPFCQSQALRSLGRNTDTGAGFIFFLEMVIASMVSYLLSSTSINNTSIVATFTLIMLMLTLAISILPKWQKKPIHA